MEDGVRGHAFVYACYRYMPVDEYQKMISGNQIFLEVDNKLAEKIAREKGKISLKASPELLEEWKREYRRG